MITIIATLVGLVYITYCVAAVIISFPIWICLLGYDMGISLKKRYRATYYFDKYMGGLLLDNFK